MTMYVVMLSVKEIEEHACRVRENDYVAMRYKYKNDLGGFWNCPVMAQKWCPQVVCSRVWQCQQNMRLCWLRSKRRVWEAVWSLGTEEMGGGGEWNNRKADRSGLWGFYTVRVFKIDAAIQNAFPRCVCSATPPQTGRLLLKIGRLLPRIGKFFPKNRKASSEERLVRTHISFQNAVQLRLRIFRVRV